MRLLIAFVFVFVLGSLGSLIYADYWLYHLSEPLDPARNLWDDLYYVWDTGKDLLIMLFISTKIKIKPLIIYCSIRLLWAITVPFTAWDRNHPLTVTIMFTVLLLGVITFLLRDLRALARKEP